MKYFFILFTISALFLSWYKGRPMADRFLASNDTVLTAGDNLTYGFGAPAQQSYPDRLTILTGLNVINAGLNGETSSEGLVRLPSLLKAHHPRLTILCYGGNDILRKRSMAELKENLRRMIKITRSSGSNVLLVSVPNMTLFGLDPLDLYEEVADETNTPLLSGILSKILSDPSLKSDQIHPNAEGYQKIAEAVYAAIKDHGWLKN